VGSWDYNTARVYTLLTLHNISGAAFSHLPASVSSYIVTTYLLSTFRIIALLGVLKFFTLLRNLLKPTPVMDQLDIEAKCENFLGRTSSEDDLGSDQLLLEHEFYEYIPHRQTTVQKCMPSLSTTLGVLFFFLSLAILAVAVFGRDLDRACLKRMTGWCKSNDEVTDQVTPKTNTLYTQHRY
jgi:hypothetical protein